MAQRLIDADALYAAFRKDIMGGLNWERILDEAPTVDAVPVVRCKDCIYAERARVHDKGFTICEASNMDITENDFCSYGERKDGERRSNGNKT